MANALSLALLLTAAGSSRRFSDSTPTPTPTSTPSALRPKKEFYLLHAKEPVLVSALSSCLRAVRSRTDSPALTRIIVTYTPGMLAAFEGILAPLEEEVVSLLTLVEGGSTRQESVRLGLEAIAAASAAPDIVMIHDACRPWVSPEVVNMTIDAANQYGGAAPFLPIVDALKQVDERGRICRHLDREQLGGIQTPQTFRFAEILAAHRQARHQGRQYHDDTEVYTAAGGMVQTVPGDPDNRKITFRHDVPAQADNLFKE